MQFSQNYWWWNVHQRGRINCITFTKLMVLHGLSHSECANNCYYFDKINGDELPHSEWWPIVITWTKLMELNCHTQNAQPIVITFTKLWSSTVTLRMRNQLLLLWLNYGDKLSHSECATNCYYFDPIMVMNCHTQNAQSIFITLTKLSSTVILRMCIQLLLLSSNYGAELSYSECANNCYYFD